MEIKRIFTQRHLCLVVLAMLLLNGFWFVREQSSQLYGLEIALPSTVVSSEPVSDSYTVPQTNIDAYAAYTRYLQRLNQAKDEPIPQLIDTLEQEKAQLGDILTIDALLKNMDIGASMDKLDSYRVQNPELVEQIANQSINISDVTLEYVAVHNLLLQASYLHDYPTFLKSIQTSKDNLLSFSIFRDADSFSGRNILKTAAEFEPLSDVTLGLGANGAIEAFMNVRLTDFLMVILPFLLVVSFLEERKRGLWSLIYATSNGRLRLAIHRVIILFGSCVLGVLLLYGENLILGFCVYGGMEDLGRAVQSIEILGKFPMIYTVSQFLIHYFLLRIAAIYLVSLFLWLLLSSIPNVKYVFMVAAAVLCMEYALYTFLPVQSYLNVFKYFNLFTYISLSDLYTNYLNVNVFGYPLGIRSVSELTLLPLCLLFLMICVMAYCFKKPCNGKDWSESIAIKCNSLTDRCLFGLRMFGMELFKTLWLQKGVVVVIIFIYVASNLSFIASIPVSSAVESAVRQYTVELEGEITNQTFTQINQIQAELDHTITTYENAKIAFQNGEIESSKLNIYAHEAELAQIKQEAISIVLQRVQDMKANGEKTGFTPWLVEYTPYESVYGEVASRNQQNASALALLALALLLAGNITYERQSGIIPLLVAFPKGRGSLLRRKVAIAGLFATMIWAVIYGLELRTLLLSIRTDTLSAPIQSLPILESLTITCTIKTFLAILYFVRLLLLFGGAMLILAISCLTGKRMTVSYIAVLGILILPSLLYFYVEFEPLKYVSFALPVQVLPLLQVEHPLALLSILCGVYVFLIGVSIWFLRKALRIR